MSTFNDKGGKTVLLIDFCRKKRPNAFHDDAAHLDALTVAHTSQSLWLKCDLADSGIIFSRRINLSAQTIDDLL